MLAHGPGQEDERECQNVRRQEFEYLAEQVELDAKVGWEALRHVHHPEDGEEEENGQEDVL